MPPLEPKPCCLHARPLQCTCVWLHFLLWKYLHCCPILLSFNTKEKLLQLWRWFGRLALKHCVPGFNVGLMGHSIRAEFASLINICWLAGTFRVNSVDLHTWRAHSPLAESSGLNPIAMFALRADIFGLFDRFIQCSTSRELPLVFPRPFNNWIYYWLENTTIKWNSV